MHVTETLRFALSDMEKQKCPDLEVFLDGTKKKCMRYNFTYAFFKSKYIKRVAMVSSEGIS